MLNSLSQSTILPRLATKLPLPLSRPDLLSQLSRSSLASVVARVGRDCHTTMSCPRFIESKEGAAESTSLDGEKQQQQTTNLPRRQ